MDRELSESEVLARTAMQWGFGATDSACTLFINAWREERNWDLKDGREVIVHFIANDAQGRHVVVPPERLNLFDTEEMVNDIFRQLTA